jgi:hypothetical protein
MTDSSIDSAAATSALLGALGEQLAAHGERYTLAVVGGAALLALGLVSRTTRDVDVLAIVDGNQLLSAQPLPTALADAAHTVARDFGLSDGWLNPGPTSLLDLGLPVGFEERAQRRDFGPGLEVLFASRVDQIHLEALRDGRSGRRQAPHRSRGAGANRTRVARRRQLESDS